MEREIFFRGKTVDNSEWAQGSLIYDEISDSTAILTYVNIGGNEPKIIDLSEINCYRVIPETVGQYTGLTDKNGRKIFEGDLIKTKKYGKDTGRSNVFDYDIFEVKYVSARFTLETYNRRFVLEDDDGNSKYEIIGNIHDRPVLHNPTIENFELFNG